MVNPSKRDSAARKVVAAARALVTYQIGLPEGCKRMATTLSSLGLYERDLPKIFSEYLNETTGLPLGSERLYWDRKILQEKDHTLEEINRRFRDRIFDTCWALIDRFAASPGSAISTE